MAQDRKSLNPQLTWLWEFLSFFAVDEIVVSNDFHQQVADIQEVLRSDVSGLVNSVLDFAINCASVELTPESDNQQFSDLIEKWFDKINYSLLGRVPIGIRALSKEYYRERWKNSSLLVLRTIWEDIEIDGTKLNLPTKMWFVDGSNVFIRDKVKNVRVIGEEVYNLKINEKETKSLPSNKSELIFVQKPYSSWSSLYPIPFLVQRGLYKTLRTFMLLNKKGERIIGKALEYLLSMKKGTENLALKGSPDYTYSEEDLKKIKDDFQKFLLNSAQTPGTPSYITNFDTQIDHLIPDYSKAINTNMYAPLERRLLCGLGLVEIIEGSGSSRRESILNPRPFIAEVETAIEDFSTLIHDVLLTIEERNKETHPKYFNNTIELHSPPIKYFITESIRDHLRSMYDRGTLSKETYVETVGGIDFEIEIKRRKQETKEGLDKDLYPPITQNTENKSADLTPFQKQETIPVSKKGPEKLNFKAELEEPYDGTDTEFVEALEEFAKIYEDKIKLIISKEAVD